MKTNYDKAIQHIALLELVHAQFQAGKLSPVEAMLKIIKIDKHYQENLGGPTQFR